MAEEHTQHSIAPLPEKKVPPPNPLAVFYDYELEEHIQRKKSILSSFGARLGEDGANRLRDNIKLFETELLGRTNGSSNTEHIVRSEPIYKDIFVSLPPRLRWVYDNLRKEFELYVRCCDADPNLIPRAGVVIRSMRKLCVDPDLLVLEQTPIGDFLEGIGDAPPKLALAEPHNHPSSCKKCGAADDVVFTTCFHSLCIRCMVAHLSRENNLTCHVCHKEINSNEAWIPWKIYPSRCEIMVQLLIMHPVKSIVLCEFGKSLRKLKTQLKSHQIEVKMCEKNTDKMAEETNVEKFCNKERNIRVLLARFNQLDHLAAYNLDCASKIYFMSAVPKTVEEKAISLIHDTRKTNPVEVYKILSKSTVEGKIFGTDVGYFDRGKLRFPSVQDLTNLV